MKHILPGLMGAALIAVAVYALVSITALNADVASAKRAASTQLAAAKSDMTNDTSALSERVAKLEVTATEAEFKDNLAADAKHKLEREIRKDSLIDLQKSSQVTDWKVRCVVATSNTLNCLGEGFLDGEEYSMSYKATVDEDGSYMWQPSYGE